MRRTATLSLFAEEKENNLANIDNLFSVNKKCFLELGIVNTVPKFNYKTKDQYKNVINNIINYQELYGDIIWFPLGLYVMFNPSVSHSMQGVTISMQLKDKMCLLNGDLGGEIHSAVDFSTQDESVDMNDGLSIEKNPVLIYNIIKQLVNHWGHEKLSNIVISEVPLRIKRAVRWTGNSPIWLIKGDKGYQLVTIQPDEQDKIKGYQSGFEFGRDVGFVYDSFTYPGPDKLNCNAGDTVTSVLDKIIGVLGNYEYFYDVFGNFIFREKQNYLNMTNVAYWQKEENSKVINLPYDRYEADYYRLTKSIYNFTNNQYTTTYNNSLNYNNIKNDFVVWGAFKGINGNTLPCRFHLAIDKKPSLNKHYVALFKDKFQTVRGIFACNPDNIPDDAPKASDTVKWLGAQYKIIEAQSRQSVDWREQIYYQMLEDKNIGTGQDSELNNTYFQYYAQLEEQFPKIFDLSSVSEEDSSATGYKVNIQEHPQEIEYFLDFIDDNSQLGCYSVSNIGRRAKIIDDNNEKINCVFQFQIPDIVYVDITKYGNQTGKIEDQLTAMGQQWTQINPQLSPLLETGGIFNSCFEKIKDLLYQYTHVNNTISITTLPIYYLEPNTRITVEDKPAGIYGDYIIQSISLPLDINSTMNINAYKALQKI